MTKDPAVSDKHIKLYVRIGIATYIVTILVGIAWFCVYVLAPALIRLP